MTQESDAELDAIDSDVERLKRHLYACPRDGTTAAVEEAAFQNQYDQLENSRERARLFLHEPRSAAAERLARWKLFEQSLNRLLGLVKRISYARNMASIKGSVDLQRLLSAKQIIEVCFSILQLLLLFLDIHLTNCRNELIRGAKECNRLSISSFAE